MRNSNEFLRQILDSITEHIVVIDNSGDIQFVNRSWTTFGNKNACLIKKDWNGINYIDECNKAAGMGDKIGSKASKGIKNVINHKQSIFYLEYPCHSPQEKRWFMMRVTPLILSDKDYFVISHHNITERKLAEEDVEKAAKIDGLTNIPNRRTFDEFFYNEWRRCRRLKKPISVALIDIDHFKILNDTYGHQSGDKCLIQVGKVLANFANRPGDICARYGGEEFALVWGDTTPKQARALAKKVLKRIVDLKIANKYSTTANHLTASIGLATVTPKKKSKPIKVISKADKMLYKAKERGRNRVEV
jgi:diguanylate cyclase (GGDEF)-like protein/PAS domain S-box-containing protein